MTCDCLWCYCCFCLCWCTKLLQRNFLNRNILIAAIEFRLCLVCKNSYHYLSIITSTQKILLCAAAFECFATCVTTVISTNNAYVWKVKCEFLYLWDIENCVEIRNRCFHHNKLFSGVKVFSCHSSRIL